jgi:hypothetical protein
LAQVYEVLSAEGDLPTITLHANAGVGATYEAEGIRLAYRISITTGTGPVSFGTLATLVLDGFTVRPYVAVSPQGALTAATFPYVETTSTTNAVLKVAGELEPGQVYVYDLLMVGV